MQMRASVQVAANAKPTSRPAIARPTVQREPCTRGSSIASTSSARVATVAGRQLICRAAQDQAVAEERWEAAVRDGRVLNVSNKEAGELMQQGWVLLDVRPPNETAKVPIAGAVAVPLFVEDPANDLGTLLKKSATFGTGGWWLGGSHMIPNQTFLQEVRAKIPVDAKVVVGCQKGLRSLAACETLSRAGYGTLAWVNGGFDTAKKGDLPAEKDLRYAGIGGVSELLGWTEVQQEERKGAMGGFENVLKLVGVVLVLDLLLFGYEEYAFLTGQPNPFQ